MNTGICPLCSRRCVVALSARTLTHTLVYSHSVTHTHTHSCIHSHTHDLTLSHTHSCTHSRTRVLTLSHSLTLTHTPVLTVTLMHSHSHSHTLPLTHVLRSTAHPPSDDWAPRCWGSVRSRRLPHWTDGPCLRHLGGGDPAAHHPPGASLTAPSSAPPRSLRVPAERLLSPLGSHTHTW